MKILKKMGLLTILLVLILFLIFSFLFSIGLFLIDDEIATALDITSLEELEMITNSYQNSENVIEKQGMVRYIIDKNKIQLSSRYLGEFDLTKYGHSTLYISDTTQYFDFLTNQKMDFIDIQTNDMLIINGRLYKGGDNQYIDATKGIIKILNSSNYNKLELEYFVGKKNISNALILTSDTKNNITLRIDKTINNVNIPFIITVSTSKQTIYKNVINNEQIKSMENINIIFEEPLDHQCLEHKTGIASQITYI